jgi:hypothetical protein
MDKKIELSAKEVEEAVKMYVESKYRFPEFEYKDVNVCNVWPCTVVLEK